MDIIVAEGWWQPIVSVRGRLVVGGAVNQPCLSLVIVSSIIACISVHSSDILNYILLIALISGRPAVVIHIWDWWMINI